jgi:hypothetical protein
MATPELVQKIRSVIDTLTKTPIDALVSNQQKWGSISFESARRDLDLMFRLGHHLNDLPIDIVPDGIATNFLQLLTQANTAVQRITAFTIESGNPTGQRDEIVGQAHAYAEQLLTATQAWIPFLAYQKGDVQRNIEALSKSVVDANEILEKAKRETAEKSKELASIISAAREASASAGVGVFTGDFTGQVITLEAAAKKWLIGTAVLAATTVVAAGLSFFLPIDKDASNAQIVQFITSKIIVLIVLLTATVWCGRVFKAIKHQSAVNSHRANALKTFQAFVKAASDDPTRNAVLLETTRSIFAIAPSGYLESTDSAADSGTKVLEIIKTATGSGKP